MRSTRILAAVLVAAFLATLLPTGLGGVPTGPARNCATRWYDAGGLLHDPTQAVMTGTGNYYGPRHPDPSEPGMAYHRAADGSWTTTYYVYQDGPCSASQAQFESCARQVPQQYVIRGAGWVPWYDNCLIS